MILYKIIFTIILIYILWRFLPKMVSNVPLPVNSSCGWLRPCKHFVEPLQDYGSKTSSMDNAPLAYESFPIYITHPEINSNDPNFKPIDPALHDIITNNETPYIPAVFNEIKNKKYYSKGEMEMDFKYFNNASNLTLYNYYNDSTEES